MVYFVDPEVVAPDRPVHVEADPGGIGGPEGEDIGLATDALSALGELQHGVVCIDLGGADEVVGARVEVILDHRPRGGFVHHDPSR
jgi:hypothetical protein